MTLGKFRGPKKPLKAQSPNYLALKAKAQKIQTPLDLVARKWIVSDPSAYLSDLWPWLLNNGPFIFFKGAVLRIGIFVFFLDLGKNFFWRKRL
jgi:hypothetical protein